MNQVFILPHQIVLEVNQVKKTSISNDELERSVYFPDVANILEPKNETEVSFEYLKKQHRRVFSWLSRYF